MVLSLVVLDDFFLDLNLKFAIFEPILDLFKKCYATRNFSPPSANPKILESSNQPTVEKVFTP